MTTGDRVFRQSLVYKLNFTFEVRYEIQHRSYCSVGKRYGSAAEVISRALGKDRTYIAQRPAIESEARASCIDRGSAVVDASVLEADASSATMMKISDPFVAIEN